MMIENIKRIYIVNRKRYNIILLGIIVFIVGFYRPVYAASCTTTTASQTLSYGTNSSINIQGTPRTTSTIDSGLQCGGTLIAVLGNQYLSAIISTINSGQLKNTQGDSIPYQIYADSAYSREILSGTTFYYLNQQLVDILGLFGGTIKNIPMYFRTKTGTYNLRAGTYTDRITVTWQWYFCSVNVVGLVCINPTQGTATSIINLTLTITNDCIVNAPDINFGNKPLASLFQTVTQSISVYCTKGSTYTIGLNNGNNAAGQQRRLAYNGNFLNYEIYQGNSTNLRWGTLTAERRLSSSADINPGAGSGLSASTQGFIYQAVILPNQSTPPAGTYSDTIIIDVIF